MIPGQAEGQQGIMFPPEQTTAAELNRLSEQPQQQAPVVTPEPTQAELEAAGQQTLPLPTANVAETTQALATPETEQTAIGQQLLQAANNRIQEQQNQLAEQQRLRAEEAARAQRQQEFDLAEQQRLNEQIAQLENARVEQILKENERLTQEVEERKAREQAQIPIPQRQPRQLSLPGMAVPYSARRQALRRGAAATPVVAEPTAAELEQAGQMTLPFPEAPAPEIAPLVERMLANNIPMQNIQEYVDDFQAAIANNDLAEQDNIIAEMEGVVESFNRPQKAVSKTSSRRNRSAYNRAVLTGQTPLERVGRGQEETRVDPETGEEFTVISYPPLPTPQRRTDAVQERSAEEVDVRQQTRPSGTVRVGDTQRSEAAEQNRAKSASEKRQLARQRRIKKKNNERFGKLAKKIAVNKLRNQKLV